MTPFGWMAAGFFALPAAVCGYVAACITIDALTRGWRRFKAAGGRTALVLVTWRDDSLEDFAAWENEMETETEA